MAQLPTAVEAARERIAGLSDFLDAWCAANPERFETLAADGRLDDPEAEIVATAPAVDEPPDFQAALRRYRDETLAIIAWRDLAGVDALEATLAALSTLADRCIEAALEHAEARVAERHGVLRDADGRPQRLIVIGMGKLGGGELNFSSDIDLIFGYRAPGESDGERGRGTQNSHGRQHSSPSRTVGASGAGLSAPRASPSPRRFRARR